MGEREDFHQEMMGDTMPLQALAIVVLYFVIAIFTFTYSEQRNRRADLPDGLRYVACGFGGLIWPLYWTGKLAYYVTEPTGIATPEVAHDR